MAALRNGYSMRADDTNNLFKGEQIAQAIACYVQLGWRPQCKYDFVLS
jgi:hypothetical protein